MAYVPGAWVQSGVKCRLKSLSRSESRSHHRPTSLSRLISSVAKDRHRACSLRINDFIRGCERLDAELANTIDSNIETVMMLEDIEAGSIRVWLRNALRATEDDALKTFDWKPAVGKYLVRAKYVVLKWLDNEGTAPRSLPALAREIQSIAVETDVKAFA